MRPLLAAASSLVLLLLVIACPAALAKKKTVTVFQDPPTYDTVETGALHFYEFWATLRTEKGGPLVGAVYGRTIHDASLWVGAPFEMRSRYCVYQFTGGNSKELKKTFPLGQVTATGVASYATNTSVFLQLGQPATIPVTGGSEGWYAATGQVTTTRLNDQHEHTHTLEIQVTKFKQGKRVGFK